MRFFSSARDDPLKAAGKQAAVFAEAGKFHDLQQLLVSFPAAALSVVGCAQPSIKMSLMLKRPPQHIFNITLSRTRRDLIFCIELDPSFLLAKILE